MLHMVTMDGEIQYHGEKIVGRSRRIDATIDETEMLRAFARKCALDVSHLWDCPIIIKHYLQTGDESLRSAAGAAAWDAAGAAAWDAAEDAAWHAAKDAAWHAAESTAKNAAWAAAWHAVWKAHTKQQRATLAAMVDAEFAKVAR